MHISTEQLKQHTIPVLLVAIPGVLLLWFLFSDVPQNDAPAPSTVSAAATVPDPAEVPTLSREGVDVAVEDIQRQDSVTTFIISFNNHAQDLSDPAIASRTFFQGVEPASYKVLSSRMGGHHVSVEMQFLVRGTGALEIGVTDDLVFTFREL